MSEIKENKAKVWAPPTFPVGGRLPVEIRKVTENYSKQTKEENLFRQTTNARGQKRHSACCHSLHISLFFDGTNNNEDNDTKKEHPSNIANVVSRIVKRRFSRKVRLFFLLYAWRRHSFPRNR